MNDSSMTNAKLMIDDTLVRRLVAAQFPEWEGLPVTPVARSGWDNKTFHLGEHMLVRMPSSGDYAMQVEKEHKWLPKLAPFLPLPIPVPLAIGEPGHGYPFRWSIYRWLDGDTAASAHIDDLCEFATSLAQFLTALEYIDPTGGPFPGPHSFYRGGSLTNYDAETRQAIAALKNKIDVSAATEVWEFALGSTWNRSPVWVHGDVSVGNLLVQEGKLSGVIDFGQLTIGDPACDLAIAWTLFEGKSREAFRASLTLDPGTWARGRAWTLWKALIIASGLTGTNAIEGEQCWSIIDEVLAEHKRNA
ncbi:MAG: aminoglycoside phosphotransferase family protein [Chlamydiae bacterium]|nr:aminoglycoside phosphotransferase family protein [Chlamydiota bacterium]